MTTREVRPSPVAALRPSVPTYIVLLTGVATAVCTLALALVSTRPAVRSLPLWVLTLMFFATASYVANFAYGRQVHCFQLCDVPRLLGLLFATPATLATARLLGALGALVLVRRQRGRKLAFNMASFALEVSTAILVFALLAPDGATVGPALWPAAIVATAAADLVSSTTVAIVIALSESRRLRDVLPGPARVAFYTSVCASILGLIVATTYAYSTSAAALLILLVVFAMVAARSWAEVVARNEEAVRLQRLLSELGPVTARHPDLARMLELVRELFGVELVHLVRYGSDGVEVCSVTAATPGQEPEPAPPPTAEHWELLDEVVSGGRPVHLAPERAFALVPRGRQQLRALAAPLEGRSGLSGAVLLADPLEDLRTLSGHDRRLLTSVGRQLAQALERGEELEALARAATHDAVTGVLSNAEFRRRTAERTHDARPCAVLLVDIARLRSVNDVFGRASGDSLLVEVAARLIAAAGSDGLAGRVGGHHFALLLPLDGTATPGALARRVRQDLQQPVDLAGLSIEVGVHVGVSVAPYDGQDPELLLRRAEAALDGAKQDPYGVVVFASEMERDAVRPLRLVSDLKALLDGSEGVGSLRLVYQHQVDLRSGRRTSVEALARWDHPELGAVPPDEFVGLAESSGLIQALTDWVLATSLADCADWRAQGHRTTVSVNLSPRSLLDPGLVGQVAGALAGAGVPASALTLELTETSVMSQPARSIVVLDALREIGVRVSVDDFGTGYSSLAYLRQLPVDEVKLDRSFLVPMGGEDRRGKAHALVRQTIGLAHSLGLQVVVEGVEDQVMYETVAGMGADYVQGWYTGRPMPVSEVHPERRGDERPLTGSTDERT